MGELLSIAAQSPVLSEPHHTIGRLSQYLWSSSFSFYTQTRAPVESAKLLANRLNLKTGPYLSLLGDTRLRKSRWYNLESAPDIFKFQRFLQSKYIWIPNKILWK